MLRPCVEEYAQNLNLTTDEAYALLKKNYDGYHFSRNSKDVYAPFSVLRALDGRNATILAMARALLKADLPKALSELRSYIASLPYDIITRKEWMARKKRESFYKLLMYVVFSLLNSKIDTEVKSVLGRADVVIKTRNDIFVLELKVDDTVDHALEQIDSKGYAIPYEADGRKVTRCGVSISSEARNITHWRIVDDENNIVDEQVFGQ